MKRIAIILFFALALSANAGAVKGEPKLPKGCTVYGQVLCEGQPLTGVYVSDGNSISFTDKKGWYFISSDKHNGSVWVSFPGGYDVAHTNGMPAFWQPLQEESQTPERHDFTLRKVDNSKHVVIAYSDVHLANIYDDDLQFREIFMPRLREEAAKYGDTPVYALNLGDSSYDRYWYEDDYQIGDWVNTLASVDFPIPSFTVMGNHDNNPAVPSGPTVDFEASLSYRESMGPCWYSFNLGNVHYIMLDDIVYKNSPGRIDDCEGVAGMRDYDAYISEEQMEWLRKDLECIKDNSTPVVVGMHVPVIAYKEYDKGKIITRFKKDGKASNAKCLEFTKLFERFDQVHFMTGHTHKNLTCHGSDDTSTFPVGNIIEHNITGVCGSWWHTRNYGGLSLAPDSGPCGFSVFPVDGSSVSWYFVSNEDGADQQFRVFDLNSVRDYYKTNGEARALMAHHPDFLNFGEMEDNMILVHVWAWEPGWKLSVIEMEAGGASATNGRELPLEQKHFENPQYTLTYAAPKMNWRDLWPVKPKKPSIQPHMFLTRCSAADTELLVTVTDNFGRNYTQKVERPKPFYKQMK